MTVADLRDGFPCRLRRSRCRSCCRRLRYRGFRVGDAELGRVLELPGPRHNDLQAVARHIRLQSSRGGPGEGASVWDVIAQAIDGDHIDRRTTEKHNGHGSLGGRLWARSA